MATAGDATATTTSHSTHNALTASHRGVSYLLQSLTTSSLIRGAMSYFGRKGIIRGYVRRVIIGRQQVRIVRGGTPVMASNNSCGRQLMVEY